jgi:SHS2 domain-containing protein
VSFRFFDHTADLGIELEATTVAALFEEAAAALCAALTEPSEVEERETRDLALEADDEGVLLVAFLNELLFWFEQGWIGRSARVELWLDESAASRRQLTAQIPGEPYDPARHPIKVLLKAATYHGLEIAREPHGWRARVVIDL